MSGNPNWSSKYDNIDDHLTEWHERVTIQQKQVTHFEIAPYQQVRRGYHISDLDEVRLLEGYLHEEASKHEMAYFWEWLDLDKRHTFFMDIKDIQDDNLKKIMPVFLEWLHERLTEDWLEQRFDEKKDTQVAQAYACDQIYELTELQTGSRRIIIPWLVLHHNECLALFDLILVSSMDKFPALTKKFDRTALDNGRIKMPYCDEVDPKHKPMDRPLVIKVGKDKTSLVHHSKLSIRYPHAERDLTPETIEAHSWRPKGQLKEIITGITYRKKPNYPRKDPWMIQKDPYAWNIHSEETFDWHLLRHTVEELHKGCDSITKRKLVVDYMNQFFAVITMEGQVEIIVKQWDTTKECSYFTRRTMNDFLMAMENKTFWLKKPKALTDIENELAGGSKRGKTAGRGRGARAPLNTHTNGSNLAQPNLMDMFDPRDKRSRDDHLRLEAEMVNQAGDNAGPLPIGIQGKGESIGKIWRYAVERKEFSKQVFNPFPMDHKLGARHDELNTWTGLRYTYAECKKAYNNPEYAKRAQIILHHIRDVICKNDMINYRWLLAWFASTIQKPWFKLHTMVVIYGYPGSGKGIFLTPFIELFGQHGLPCHDMGYVLGKFNSQVCDKCMVWLDEAMSPGSKKEENAFKLFITEGSQRIEEKFKNAKVVRNFSNVIASTNDLKSVPAGNNSRRYFCLDMDNRYSMNREAGRIYFDRLQHAIEDDDYAGMKAWQAIMMEIDISNFDRAQNPPQTALLRIQQHEQVDSVTRWLYDCCERGFHCKVSALQDNNHLMMFTFKDGRVGTTDDGVLESEWIREISKKDLYDNYCASTPKQPVTQNTFFMRLKELLPSIIDKTVTIVNGKKVYGSIEHKIRVMENGQKVRRNLVYIVLPSLDDARAEFKHSTGFGFTAAATTVEAKRKKTLADRAQQRAEAEASLVNIDSPNPNTPVTDSMQVVDLTPEQPSHLLDDAIHGHQHNPYDYFDPQTWENLKLLLEQVEKPMPIQDDPTLNPSTHTTKVIDAIPKVKYPDEPSSTSSDNDDDLDNGMPEDYPHDGLDHHLLHSYDVRAIPTPYGLRYESGPPLDHMDMQLMNRFNQGFPSSRVRKYRDHDEDSRDMYVRGEVEDIPDDDDDADEEDDDESMGSQGSSMTPGQTSGFGGLFHEPERAKQVEEPRLQMTQVCVVCEKPKDYEEGMDVCNRCLGMA